MGMGGSKSAPDTPDLDQLISTGVGGNWGMADANRKVEGFATSSPYGDTGWYADRNAKGNVRKVTYTDPYTGEKYKTRRMEQRITLSPEEQQKYDLSNANQIGLLQQGNQMLGGMGNFGLTPFDYTRSLGEIGGNIYQPGKDLSGEAWSGNPLDLSNKAVEERINQLGSRRLDPRFAREAATQEAQLLEKGIRRGTPAYAAAMTQQDEAKNDAYNQLALMGWGQAANQQQAEWQSRLQGNQQRFGQLAGARTLGMGEQAQQFGQSQSERARQLAERGQYAGEEFQNRNRMMQELQFALTGGKPNMPQFTGSQPQGSPYFDYPGAINTNWDQQFKAWAQEQANKSGMMGGGLDLIGKLGGAAIASDERIKDNIQQVGKTQDGLPIYEFSIGDGNMQTGVMAQDVEKVDPSAVVQDPATGIKGVNYDQAVGDGTGTYTVEKGDSIWDIGERLGVDPQAIIEANPDIQNPDFIVPGQQLVVPGMASPGPEAIPMGPMPGGGQAAVANALAGGAGPGMMPPGGGMPAAMPMTEPVSAPPPAAAGGLTPEQAATIMELKRRFPDLRVPVGGMGAY